MNDLGRSASSFSLSNLFHYWHLFSNVYSFAMFVRQHAGLKEALHFLSVLTKTFEEASESAVQACYILSASIFYLSTNNSIKYFN